MGRLIKDGLLIDGGDHYTINDKALEPPLHFQSEDVEDFEDNLASASESIRKGCLAPSRHFSNEVGRSVGFKLTVTSEADEGLSPKDHEEEVEEDCRAKRITYLCSGGKFTDSDLEDAGFDKEFLRELRKREFGRTCYLYHYSTGLRKNY